MRTDESGEYAAIYRPYHLLGIETPISILCAGLLNITTGSLNCTPYADLAAIAINDIKAGTIIPDGHGDAAAMLEPVIIAASPVDGSNALPYYMAVGNCLKEDVPAGTLITGAMIEPPQASRLWGLRREQDRAFFI